MRTIRNLLVAVSLLLPLAAFPQSLSDLQAMSAEDRRIYIESMSDDERTAMQSKWRAEFEQLPEEEKAAIREQRGKNRDGKGRDREAMQKRWDAMSEEERAAMTERRHAYQQKRRAEWDAMSEDERAAAREQRAEHKGQKNRGEHDDKPGVGKSDTDPKN